MRCRYGFCSYLQDRLPSCAAARRLHDRVATAARRQTFVAEVMAPASQLVTVPTTATVARAEELVHRSGHSRVLVVGASSDDVVGFLHAKDLLRIADEDRDGLLPSGLVRVALRVRAEDRLSDLLPRMRRARRHVAVVSERDDRGVERVVGLVTLEDVLEAIVGDIRDEWDRPGT